MRFNPFSALTSKIFCGISLALLLATGGLWLGLRHVSHQRDELREWKAEVVSATRAAAHRPRLAEKNVATQIRYLGADLDALLAAQDRAEARARLAKQERERRDRDNKRRSDDALPAQIADQRRRSGAWADTHRVQRGKSAPPEARRSPGRADLPSPAFGAAQPDRPGGGAEFVAVPAAYLDACDTVTARLLNAKRWAQEALAPPDPAPAP